MCRIWHHWAVSISQKWSNQWRAKLFNYKNIFKKYFTLAVHNVISELNSFSMIGMSLFFRILVSKYGGCGKFFFCTFKYFTGICSDMQPVNIYITINNPKPHIYSKMALNLIEKVAATSSTSNSQKRKRSDSSDDGSSSRAPGPSSRSGSGTQHRASNNRGGATAAPAPQPRGGNRSSYYSNSLNSQQPWFPPRGRGMYQGNSAARGRGLAPDQGRGNNRGGQPRRGWGRPWGRWWTSYVWCTYPPDLHSNLQNACPVNPRVCIGFFFILLMSLCKNVI